MLVGIARLLVALAATSTAAQQDARYTSSVATSTVE
jgi:hypothetical protein